MKITYVINSIKRSGPNQVLLNMVSGLVGNDYSIEVVAFFDGGDLREVKKLEKLGAKVVILGVPKSKIISVGSKRLKQHLSNDIDIVHSHGILSDIAVIRAGFGSKAVSTIHNDMFEDYIFTFGKSKGLLYIFFHIWYLRFFKQVVCCSEAANKKLSRYIRGSISIVNGIAYDKQKPVKSAEIDVRKQLGIPTGAKVFLYTGKLTNRKNVIGLLESFSKACNQNEYLIIVGEGDLMSECVKYASKNIFIVGFQAEVMPYYKAADVYVSASRSEGFSISVVEALAENLLLLLSDIPSHLEVFAIDKGMYIGEIFSKDSFLSGKNQLEISKTQSREYYDRYLTDQVMMKAYKKVYLGAAS